MSAVGDWAASGAMALTGYADGPPQLSPGAPATSVVAGLADFAVASGCSELGVDVGVFSERAAIAGYTRNAPVSVGGSFRMFEAADGWVGFSLARDSDIDDLPALTERPVDDDPWPTLASWLSRVPAAKAVERAWLFGIPAVEIAHTAPTIRRAGVIQTDGAPAMRLRSRPLVVDLTSLWAGPLAAHLLGLVGARVIKVESTRRPDGARLGPRGFYDLMHAGHESVALDFTDADDRAVLRRLLHQADVVLEASRPAALHRLGIAVEEYVARGTIWASITAYGRTGADADRVGFGDDVAAGAGLVGWDGESPYPIGDALADPLAGVAAAAAVAGALLVPGRGCLLDVSMHDVAVAAAVLPSERDAQVVATQDGWSVVVGGERFPVCEPSARRPAGVAAQLGEHTRAVVEEFRLGG